MYFQFVLSSLNIASTISVCELPITDLYIFHSLIMVEYVFEAKKKKVSTYSLKNAVFIFNNSL